MKVKKVFETGVTLAVAVVGIPLIVIYSVMESTGMNKPLTRDEYYFSESLRKKHR